MGCVFSDRWAVFGRLTVSVVFVAAALSLRCSATRNAKEQDSVRATAKLFARGNKTTHNQEQHETHEQARDNTHKQVRNEAHKQAQQQPTQHKTTQNDTKHKNSFGLSNLLSSFGCRRLVVVVRLSSFCRLQIESLRFGFTSGLLHSRSLHF